MTEIKVERHPYNPGESFETEANGPILSVVDPDATNGNFVDVFILVPGEKISQEGIDQAIEEAADEEEGATPEDTPLTDHDLLTARQQTALEDAGFETVGDLPEDLSGLTDINGIGEGTVGTLKAIRE